MITIQPLTPDLHDAYSEYLAASDHPLFYYSLKYKDFLESITDAQSHYLVAMEGDTVRGILPLMACEGQFGTVWNSLSYYGSHGGAIADTRDIAQALYDYAIESVMIDAAAYTFVMHPHHEHTPLAHTHRDERIGQWTPLHPTQDEIFSLIDSATRRNIRKAEKSGITVRIDDTAFDFLQKTHLDNMAVMGGNAKDAAFFNEIPNSFTAGEDYNIYVAYHDDTPVSALLLFYYGDTVEYFTPATVGDYRNMQPSALIIMHAMIDAAKNGYRWWNWGGTWKSQDGVYKFKKKWGAQDFAYPYYTTLNNHDILSASPADLLNGYKNFYVVPFDALKDN